MAKPSKKKRRSDSTGVPASAPVQGDDIQVAGGLVKPSSPRKKTGSPSKIAKPTRSAVAKRSKRKQLEAIQAPQIDAEADRLIRLQKSLQQVRDGRLKSLRTQKLLDSGVPKMAQKVVEEAAEAAIDAVRGERMGLINESADLLFNLAVLWHALEIRPGEVWAEMDRREAMLGLAEKLPKPVGIVE